LVRSIFFALGDQGFYINSQGFSFCQSGNNPLVSDKLRSEIAQQRSTMRGGSAEVFDFVSVTHDV
jgi:hypothetical protein